MWNTPSTLHPSGKVSRRRFCLLAGSAGAFASISRRIAGQGASGVHFSVADFDRQRILSAAEKALKTAPLSLVAQPAPGKGRDTHAFYSEQIPAREAQLENSAAEPFLAHVDLLVQMNANIAVLTAAWRLNQSSECHAAAMAQLRTWMIAPATRMTPSLQLSGVKAEDEADPRYNGLAQTVALAETARAASFLLTSADVSTADASAVRQWFADLLTWLNESQKGTIARDAKDLQSICWAMQAAELARFTRNDILLRECTHRFREKLLRQMNLDGIFTAALNASRPYALAMFTLECMAATCESISTPFESLWRFNLPDGRGMHSAVAWASPYLQSRGKWPYVSDTRYFGEQPQRQNALLFAGRAYDRLEYTDLWKTLPTETGNKTLRREHPITQPALWTARPPA